MAPGNCKVAALALCALLAVAASACDPSALTPCMSAIMLGAAPTADCCARLLEQQPCLCQYARDPSYRGYVTSPSAQSAILVKTDGAPRHISKMIITKREGTKVLPEGLLMEDDSAEMFTSLEFVMPRSYEQRESGSRNPADL
ncbi:hypothetical protein GUJ93_ZPchr0006g41616 [Zizania palustris]|uniref:Bifunctional inhibitor/plant lipid transfer protein/seed storage helical domain-containing protein n=1 Tax=Zizania palustris TaxID=103762 RepID=A0A8J5SKM5_ZIZPA|nr:hypothetical protein GUJ93_ZPchr0006g41616 [Zizania palustris]